MTDLLETLEILIRQAPWLAWIWIVFVGGCFGSFMNVVVYRLPAGKSLLHPGSQCPECGHSIRWYDNLPVIGWLRLRGRCRDCNTAISPRYPLVEALVMCLFAIQWTQDVSRVAATEPLGPALFAFVWHTALLCVLVCVALIDFDGDATPKSLIRFGTALPLAMTLVAPAAAAHLLKVDDFAQVVENLVMGAGLAALVTIVLKPNFRALRRQPPGATDTNPWTSLALSAMSGVYLGPDRAVAALVLTSLLWRLLRWIRVGTSGGAPWSWYLAALCWATVALPT